MHLLLVRIHDGTATLENYLAVSYKAQHILIIQPRNPATQLFAQEKCRSMSTQKPVCQCW